VTLTVTNCHALQRETPLAGALSQTKLRCPKQGCSPALRTSWREKAAKRAEQAEQNALTFRQRLGVSLSKLTQEDLDALVRGAARSGQAHNALSRLADQAFGKPQEAEEDAPQDDMLACLTREQRAVMQSWLEENQDEAPAQG
jgi:hypothetical protein